MYIAVPALAQLFIIEEAQESLRRQLSEVQRKHSSGTDLENHRDALCVPFLRNTR